MAIYEYKCTECGKISTRYTNVSSELKNVHCDHCGEFASKVISAPNFIVNGYSYKNGYSIGGQK